MDLMKEILRLRHDADCMFVSKQKLILSWTRQGGGSDVLAHRQILEDALAAERAKPAAERRWRVFKRRRCGRTHYVIAADFDKAVNLQSWKFVD